jgi:hypothetical protein
METEALMPIVQEFERCVQKHFIIPDDLPIFSGGKIK